jgi:hypothetical protein
MFPSFLQGNKEAELALAEKAQEEPNSIQIWLAPLKKKLLEAKRAGASTEELKAMLAEARLNTNALAKTMQENIEDGFFKKGD